MCDVLNAARGSSGNLNSTKGEKKTIPKLIHICTSRYTNKKMHTKVLFCLGIPQQGWSPAAESDRSCQGREPPPMQSAACSRRGWHRVLSLPRRESQHVARMVTAPPGGGQVGKLEVMRVSRRSEAKGARTGVTPGLDEAPSLAGSPSCFPSGGRTAGGQSLLNCTALAGKNSARIISSLWPRPHD